MVCVLSPIATLDCALPKASTREESHDHTFGMPATTIGKYRIAKKKVVVTLWEELMSDFDACVEGLLDIRRLPTPPPRRGRKLMALEWCTVIRR